MASRKVLFAGAIVLMTVTGGIGLIMHLQNGVFPWTSYCKPESLQYKGMVSSSPDQAVLIGDRSKKGSFVVWGDSHAGALLPAFDVAGKKNGVSGYVFSAGSTLPIPSIERVDSGFDEKAFNEGVLSLIRAQDIKTVFLAGAWSHYAIGKGDISINGGKAKPGKERIPLILAELQRTVDLLEREGLKVVVVLDVPVWNINPVRFACLEKRYPHSNYLSEWRSIIGLREDFQKFTPYINDFIMRECENVVELVPYGEQEYAKLIIRDRTLLYNDSNHLSAEGAVEMGMMIENSLAN